MSRAEYLMLLIKMIFPDFDKPEEIVKSLKGKYWQEEMPDERSEQ